jgi:enamine deaminase RidA (YjgF/YER057c/UK114 family)
VAVVADRFGRRLISSGSEWEERYAYSRAVVANGHVYVAGTAPIMSGGADPPSDASGQARRCVEIILEALAEAGAKPEDVVRTRVFVTESDYMPDALGALKEAFSGARPACTGIVTQLVDPRWLVEIEVEAVLPE